MKVKKILALSLSVAMLAGGVLSVSAQGLSDVFSADYYAGKYGDLKANGVTSAEALLNHAVANGIKEGRDVSPILDVAAYRAAYADLEAAFGDNWDAYVDHYLTYGIKEGRTAGVKFDLKDYVAKNADLKAAFGDDYVALAKHYVTLGINENRQGGKIVQTTAKAASNSGSSSSSSASKPASTPASTVTTPQEHEHNWVVVAQKEGTCTEEGYIDYKCNVPKTKQIWENGKLVRTELVLGVDGQPIYCDATYRKTTGTKHVPPQDADGNLINYYCVPATCLAAGVEKYTCARCGEQVVTTLPKLEHVFEFDHKVLPRSCDAAGAGYDVEVCWAGCKQTRKTNYTYLDHQVATYDIDVKPATCTAEGEAWGICSKCGQKVKQTIPMKEHVNAATPVIRYVDSYKEDKTAPCHTMVTLTICKDCSRIDAVVVGAESNCVDNDKNGQCDVCLHSMSRNHTNQVMSYVEGQRLNDKYGQ